MLVILRTLSFLSTVIPLSFSMLLYDIHSSSSVSPTASNPFRFLILFRDRDNMRKHFNPFKFAILSIAFVLNTSFWQLIRVSRLKFEMVNWTLKVLQTYLVSILSIGGIRNIRLISSASAGSTPVAVFHLPRASWTNSTEQCSQNWAKLPWLMFRAWF